MLMTLGSGLSLTCRVRVQLMTLGSGLSLTCRVRVHVDDIGVRAQFDM